ncbi:hypothetical protein [Pseudoxanthomonas composti]|uniref:hypothetical protein n=1 Tax=Pseudoxanthomonas composti TaxID=2137479 RepID=UPI0013E94A90|nr:hypothetical protein [Pseudoxanthomonas composti]
MTQQNPSPGYRETPDPRGKPGGGQRDDGAQTPEDIDKHRRVKDRDHTPADPPPHDQAS